MLAGHDDKSNSILTGMLLLGIETTNNRRNVIELGRPLTKHPTVELLQVVVWLTRFCSRS